MKPYILSSCVITLIIFWQPLSLAAELPAGVVLDARQDVVRHLKDEPVSLDPAKAVGLPEIQVIRDLFEGLVNEDAHGKPAPGVAESWHSNNFRIWTFKLRKDARWSDGSPVTAQDFVYSWRRLVNPQTASPFAWFAALAGIKNAFAIAKGNMALESLGVSALDNTTLRVQLERPVPWFPSLAANAALFPVRESNLARFGQSWTAPGQLVGNGAFVLRERVVNEKLVLTPNRQYWDNAKTVLQRVTFVPVNQESAATKRYLAGDIDITESFPQKLYHKLLKEIPRQVHTPPQLGTYYYAFNTQKGPTADVRVRQALTMSIDRRIVAQKVLGTGEKPAWHFTPDVTAGFSPERSPLETTPQAELNAQAKTLLQAAGYGPQRPLELSLLYNTSENHQKIAIAVASMWKKNLGVRVKLRNQEWKTYLDSRNSGDFDVIRASWVGDYNEASSFLSLLTTSHSGTIARIHDDSYDAALAKAGSESLDAARNRAYNIAENILLSRAPVAPIYQYTNARLIKPWVRGYPIDNPEDVAYSRMLYVIKHDGGRR